MMKISVSNSAQLPDVVIRQALPKDIEDLIGLLHYLFSIEEDFDFDADKQRRGLGLMLDSKSAVVFVALANDRIIGMCTGQLTISTAEGGPSLLLEDMVIVEQWQGRGVGRLLMDALEHWATSKKLSRLQLLADRNNQTALEFYKTLDWQATELICLRRRI